MITNHYGHTVDSDKPITGVHSIHDMNWDFFDWNDEICLDCEEMQEGIEEQNVSCPECGETSYPEANGTEDQDDEKRICNGCGLQFIINDDEMLDIDMIECDSSHTKLIGDWIKGDDGKYDFDPNGEYAAIEEETTIQVVFSKYTERHALCSPCYPGQADADSDGDYLCYILPPELTYKESDK